MTTTTTDPWDWYSDDTWDTQPDAHRVTFTDDAEDAA